MPPTANRVMFCESCSMLSRQWSRCVSFGHIKINVNKIQTTSVFDIDRQHHLMLKGCDIPSTHRVKYLSLFFLIHPVVYCIKNWLKCYRQQQQILLVPLPNTTCCGRTDQVSQNSIYMYFIFNFKYYVFNAWRWSKGESRLLWWGFLIWGGALFHTKGCCALCIRM